MRAHIIFWLFFMLFSSINSSTNNFLLNGNCRGHQRAVLLQLKNNLIFNPEKSSKLVHWNQSEYDCCKWHGVTCKDGHVTALDLSQESISGGLNDSSAIFSLQGLNLAFNKFNFVIPQALHKLQNLRYLNLSDAGFEEQVPKEIAHLTRLVTLDLSSLITSRQNLKLENPNIEMLVKNLTDITELYLDGVAISSSGDEWGRALSLLEGVRVLSMSSCNLSGPIDSSLAKLQSLSVLRLNNNKLSSKVPDSFANFSNLTILEISSCGLNGFFPKEIFQIHTLKVLDISDNQNLSGSLPDFSPLASLKYLNLADTNFSGPLPNTISNLKHLSTIDLSHCQFNGTLPSSMSELTQLGLINLVSINLGFNSFNGSVPSSVLKLPCLRELKLPYNKLCGILGEFHNASSPLLEMIDLSNNYLEGPIPLSIFNLQTLRFIQLSSNKFNGTVKLDVIRRLSNLTVLGLSYNNILVDVNFKYDHNMSSFPKMRILDLESCKLLQIPSFLKNQSTILSIHMADNNIEGPIPKWIWQLESLVSLNLSHNYFTGLEESFSNFSSNLNTVDLSYNNLQGPIPLVPKYAAYLDYSSNNFSSIIRPDIGNHLPYMTFMFLSNNKFQGQIHDSFCNASSLRLLDLSHNNFVGTIPKCFEALSSSLRVLNFGGNKLRGQIPSSMFPNLCALRFVDLNDNLLGGPIPTSLINCKELQVLNLEKNALTGRFPCFLSKIPTLRIMVLRSNKLHGSIRCPNSTGYWKMLHIVDLACNNFSGMISSALLNSWQAMMRDEDVLGPEFGSLFFEVYDNYHQMGFKDVVRMMEKFCAKQVTQLLLNMSHSDLYQVFSDRTAEHVDLGRYQESIIIVNKGHQMKLVKVQTAFTYVDMSSNYLEGQIPDELMQFKALMALNLSHNALTGHIPSSVENLKHLESMDLSNNSLNGEIPQGLSSLSFLAYMNLSFNHLVGRIPLGTQIQSFDVDSFKGNEGLCGPPLTTNCDDGGVQGLPPPASELSPCHNNSSIDWNFLSVELGFIFGLGIFILPLVCLMKWRLWYSNRADEMLHRFIPQLDFVYEQHEGKRCRSLRWRY
ncbi:receptor-like protein 7 [Medicago truncatula]|uniref:receptor-like protein 7 n=1 Tax=Medicago truncatula TaxID=3880 RepID=UPI0000D5DDA9|nr:receptor-like protein 7 [Medicago truncatula]